MVFTIGEFEKKLFSEVSFFNGNGRDSSINFLVWFLKNYFRIDEDEALGFVCDHKNDKGIDGIYVDEETEEVYLFQSKFRDNFAQGEGDGDLRKFVGSTEWFTLENIGRLDESRASQELKELVSRLNVFDLISQGYKLRPVFVTTGYFDHSGRDYVTLTSSKVEYWDNKKLFDGYTYSDKADFVHQTFTLELDSQVITYSFDGNSPSYILTLKATDLLRLNGIVDRTLFAKNVRFGLGRTNVNKQISDTIRDPLQHKKFLLFHNGITLIAEKVRLDSKRKKLTITNYSIVNGCQSTLCLYDNKDKLTKNLRIVLKVIQTGNNTKLGESVSLHQ